MAAEAAGAGVAAGAAALAAVTVLASNVYECCAAIVRGRVVASTRRVKVPVMPMGSATVDMATDGRRWKERRQCALAGGENVSVAQRE